jgi:hypothetical protein
VGVDDQAHLRDRDREHRRPHQPHDPADLRVGQRGAQVGADPRQHPEPHQRGHLQRELRDPAGDHAGRERVDRRVEPRRQQQRGRDERQVQQHRREGRHRESAPGVQDARRQRDHRDQQDVGEHPAGHHHAGLECARPVLQTRGHRPDQRRRGDDPGRRDCDQGPEQHRGDMVDERSHRGLVARFARAREDRHEGLRERALGEHPPQQVGQPECDEEGVGQRRGAEDRRGQVLPDQPGDAREQREAADRRGRSEQVHARARATQVARLAATPRKAL